SKPGVVGQMMAAAEERPWLWIVYILTVALPVFLVILFCCSGKKQPSDAGYKKTDAPQPDVKEEEEEEEEKANKVEEEEEEEESEKQEMQEEADGDEDQGSQEEEDAEVESKPKEDDNTNRSPRNRKPRRD
ncbi:hypothetical protein GDO86_018462, partial [Hymenochirus boettgeri]